ncbi:MAG TPA: serine hydrolase domain-containing protein [Quisquiliibacterium sp.]|nr:serine hydrolase domain-containing protein [Quisquiliibacterium sp.]
MPASPSLPLADPYDLGLSPAQLTRMSDAFRAEIDRGRLPGAVLLVGRKGRVGWFESLGMADPVRRTPMAHDTIFRIYSMTKPIVSLAVMMLVEEGRLLLDDPASKYMPEYAAQKVGVERNGRLELVPVERDATVQDLLRHTSGLAYEFTGESAVQKKYIELRVGSRSKTNAEFSEQLASLPLMHQPGAQWEYSRSTDTLGRLIEVVSGQSLGAFLAERILDPLGMVDTAFHVPPDKQHRLAEAFETDPDSGASVRLLEVRDAPRFESGGGGLVSTAIDYARFLQMLDNGGTLDGVRLVGRKTLEWMTADHLGGIPSHSTLLPPGHGFGLGFAVRLQPGIDTTPGSVGQYFWSGLAGTTFWVDPLEELFALLLVQAPNQREYCRTLFRSLVYAALA